MGFKGGNILDPSTGTGRFIGLMPEHIANNSNIYAVEIDPYSSKIAKYLYPDVEIKECGFQDAEFSNNAH